MRDFFFFLNKFFRIHCSPLSILFLYCISGARFQHISGGGVVAILSLARMTKLLTLSLRERPITLWRKGAACTCDLILYPKLVKMDELRDIEWLVTRQLRFYGQLSLSQHTGVASLQMQPQSICQHLSWTRPWDSLSLPFGKQLVFDTRWRLALHPFPWSMASDSEVGRNSYSCYFTIVCRSL